MGDSSNEADYFIKVPEWLTLAGLSPQALGLYVILLGHVNREKGDNVAKPMMETIAELMGYSKRQSITRYLEELVALGVVKIRTAPWKGGRRNYYTVSKLPPDGWDRPLSIATFHKLRGDADADDAAQTGEGSSPVADLPLNGGSSLPADDGSSAPADWIETKETRRSSTDFKDSSASRRQADARRENFAQALKHHQHRRTIEGRRARRAWEMDGVSSAWLTRRNPFLGEDIVNYVGHKWGCEDNVRTLTLDLVRRVRADGSLEPPQKILNTALKEARWVDDEPPSVYLEMGLAEFTPVLSMPADEQLWYERDDATYDDEDGYEPPAPAAGGDPWSDPWVGQEFHDLIHSKNPF